MPEAFISELDKQDLDLLALIGVSHVDTFPVNREDTITGSEKEDYLSLVQRLKRDERYWCSCAADDADKTELLLYPSIILKLRQFLADHRVEEHYHTNLNEAKGKGV